jgi:predicted membrane protein
LDTTTIINLVLSVVIVALAIVAYTSKKSKIAMYIGAAFALFGISHLMTLIGLDVALAYVLLIIRTLAYLIIIFALYKIWKP